MRSLVAVTGVRRSPPSAQCSAPSQVRTLLHTRVLPGEHLESVLGATPHEFESRILAIALTGQYVEGRRCHSRGMVRCGGRVSAACPRVVPSWVRVSRDTNRNGQVSMGETVEQVRALAGWVGTGRKLTQTGRVTLADA